VRSIHKVIVTICLAAGCAVAQPPGLPEHFQIVGMIGIAPGQTARLNLLHADLPAPLATGIVCSANISFLDDQGQTLKSSSVTGLAAGHSVSLTLNADSELASHQNSMIRGLVAVPTNSGGGFCPLVPTLELIDNATGRTTVVLHQTYASPACGLDVTAAGRSRR
jgi:hypothetical protein